MKFELRIQRQGIDPTAESSLHALRDLMQLPVVAVEHGELLRFEVRGDVDTQAARAAFEQAASRAGRYVNLNRDAMIWEVEHSTRPAPSEATSVDVLVRQGDGKDTRALQWFRQYSGIDCRSVIRGRWYRIYVDAADAQEARRCVEDLATSRTRTAGLLANPHSEHVEILRVQTARQVRATNQGDVGHAV